MQKLNSKLLRTYVMSDIIIKWKCSGAQPKIFKSFGPTVISKQMQVQQTAEVNEKRKAI